MKISTGKITLIVVGVLVLIILFSAIGSYNSMIKLSENIETQKAQIENNIQRRADLIPNIVNSVKGYMTHEQDAIDSVTNARQRVMNATTDEELAAADDELNNAIKGLNINVLIENYPDLKANESFRSLNDNLERTENRISIARKDHNEAVKAYNSKIRTFPSNIIASMFGFEKAEYFEASENAQKVPDVNFNTQE